MLLRHTIRGIFIMTDTIILTSIGINIAEYLDNYEVLDRSCSIISIKVKHKMESLIHE